MNNLENFYKQYIRKDINEGIAQEKSVITILPQLLVVINVFG